jgi:DNA-binding response OmpR family regulator
MGGEIRALHRCRVLVIEDEYLIADDLRNAISHAGAEVLGPLFSLEEAEARLQSDGFDVVVLDINLRDRMAYTVADKLVELGIPIVFATGYEKSMIPHRFAAVNVWTKPFDYDELAKDIIRLCPALGAA